MINIFLKTLLTCLIAIAATGCATTNKDPLEGVNRGVYKFNDVADKAVLKPVAKAYKQLHLHLCEKASTTFLAIYKTLQRF